jgi:mannose-1-phosphate guanylyltransferase / mannose-6-phosphate isomerase
LFLLVEADIRGEEVLTQNIVPIVLCGGVGSRLWPLSRQNMPKQFVPLIDESSMFEGAVRRSTAIGTMPPIIVTSSNYRFFVQSQLRDCGVTGHILLEPSAKNTAPAVFAASYFVHNFNENALALVMPSDHYIPDEAAFADMVQSGCAAAMSGSLVTFGVKPNKPNTGYGYIELGQNTLLDCYDVKKFHEKPTLDIAEQMFTDSNHVWNSGIFLCCVSTLMDLGQQLEPKMLTNVRASVDLAEQDNNFWYLGENHWNQIDAQSFDYAILEKTNQISCVKFLSKWSDLGDWNAVADQLLCDKSENLTQGNVTQIDCNSATLWGASDKIHLVGLGLDNIVAVATDDAVLVADASRVQEVRDVVHSLNIQNVSQACQHAKDHRPWGWFESLIIMPGYQVKRLHVYPGAELSLQSHQYRSEHWVAVSGTATVTRDEEIITLKTNESVYIDAGQKHRLSNHTFDPLIVIEVQTGSYLGEDDIIRYDDVYNRCSPANANH